MSKGCAFLGLRECQDGNGEAVDIKHDEKAWPPRERALPTSYNARLSGRIAAISDTIDLTLTPSIFCPHDDSHTAWHDLYHVPWAAVGVPEHRQRAPTRRADCYYRDHNVSQGWIGPARGASVLCVVESGS